MTQFNIRDKCHINTNKDTDTFVGLICKNGDFSVNFPICYSLSIDDTGLRKDIILLMKSLSAATKSMDSSILKNNKEFYNPGFPVSSYLYIITDFFNRGYYIEREVEFRLSQRGKIDWGRTIKTVRPTIQGLEAYYLNFMVVHNSPNDNELITLIHEYCVYESFSKLGWLYTEGMPAKPRIEFNKRLFISVIQKKLTATQNDQTRKLLANMSAIVNSLQDSSASEDFLFGTNRFEYVWEFYVNRVFGISDKENYFPKTRWLIGDSKYSNANLEPDSIMVYKNDVYVLDAKYYKYGATRRFNDLPESTSINKQITYGEYIAENQKFADQHGPDYTVYNAFILPFSQNEWMTDEHCYYIGDAVSDWKKNLLSYERIKGILIDVKWLLLFGTHNNIEAIDELSCCITTND